jgi:hypothetical protein
VALSWKARTGDGCKYCKLRGGIKPISSPAASAGGVERVPDNRYIDRVANRSTLPTYCSSNITAATEAMSERLVKYNSSLFQGTQPTVCLSQEVGGLLARAARCCTAQCLLIKPTCPLSPSPSTVQQSDTTACARRPQATGGKGFCWESQPEWLAYRDSSIGHGLLTIYNATHMKFDQKRTDDNNIIDSTGQTITGTFKPSLDPDSFIITQVRRPLTWRSLTSPPLSPVARGAVPGQAAPQPCHDLHPLAGCVTQQCAVRDLAG